MKVITLEKLSEFLAKCKELFATKTEVDTNDADIEDYVVNIADDWYENNVAFDTSEIVGGD